VAARRNPEGRAAVEGKQEAAAKLLEDFSGHEAGRTVTAEVRNIDGGLVFGELDGVLYSATRDGKRERYLHEFRRKSRPLLAASHDGKQLAIVGGRYQFTDAGITDK
jgi:hypothetical protein